MICKDTGLAGELLLGPTVNVTSITARLPRVEDRLLLHKQMIESLPSALLVCDAITLEVVEHNSPASALFNELGVFGRPLRNLVGHPASAFFPNFAATLGPLLRE